MQVVILAGGLGTRLRPLTYAISKPMVPILGKPFLFYQLKLLEQQGYFDVLLLVGYLGNQIREYFGDGSSIGMYLEHCFEAKPLGTGGALKQAENLLSEEFFVIYGDSYLPIELKDVEQQFSESGKMGLIVVYTNRENTDVKNNIAVDDQLNVIKYDKDHARSDLKYVDAGVLVFNRRVTDFIEGGRSVSLEKEVFPSLIEQKELVAYVTEQAFYDIGTPERLKRFENFLRGQGYQKGRWR